LIEREITTLLLLKSKSNFIWLSIISAFFLGIKFSRLSDILFNRQKLINSIHTDFPTPIFLFVFSDFSPTIILTPKSKDIGVKISGSLYSLLILIILIFDVNKRFLKINYA